MTEALLSWLGQASLHVALLVGVLLVLEVVAGRWLTPRWRYGLWLLVFARLLLPAVPSLPMGGPAATLAGSLSAAAPPPALVAPQLQPSGSPQLRRGVVEPRAGAGPRRVASPAASVTPAPRVPPPADVSQDAPVPWPAVVVLLWGAGAGLLLVLSVWRTLRFARVQRRLPVSADARLRALLDACCRDLGVCRRVELVETALVAAPAVTGVRRPRLLLPQGLGAELGDDELRHVFAHELAHVRRGDVATGFILHALSCVYWFHPLVWVALRRLRAAQESARDWEALAADPASPPAGYARTLLKLCEARSGGPVPALGLFGLRRRARDVRRRIVMIQQFDPSRAVRRASLAGSALLLGLVWVGFTDAALPGADAVVESQDPARGLRRVRVERATVAPAWRTRLEARLDEPVTCAFEDAPVSAVLASLREQTGVNLMVVPRDLIDDVGDPEISFVASDLPLRQVLQAVGRRLDGARISLMREAVCVFQGLSPEELELRFYRVDPLWSDADESYGDQLCHFVRELTDRDQAWTWDAEGVTLECWNGVLAVNQTPAMHARVEAFVNRLLNRGAQPPQEPPVWRTRIEALLARPATVDVEDAEAHSVLAALGAEHGVSISIHEDLSVEPVTLRLQDVTLGAAVSWIAAQVQCSVRIADGGVWLDDGTAPTELGFYDLRPLLRACAENQDIEPEWVEEWLADMIRNRVMPEVWDDCGLLMFWRDQLLVQAPAGAHQQIAPLLAALQRVMTG